MSIGGVGSYNRLRLTGLSSGLDVDDTVSQLMFVARQPLERLLQRRQLLEWQQDAYQGINSKLSAFDTATAYIRQSSAFNPRVITSGNSEIVTATTSANQPTGSYTIKVNALAAGVGFYSGAAITKPGGSAATLAEQFAVANPESPIEFTITNSAANGGNPVTFSFDPLTQNIANVVAEINNSGLELQAFYDANTDRFFLNSTKTGAAVRVSFDSDTSGFLSMLQLQQNGADVVAGAQYGGTDASINFNGADLSYASNQFSINGVAYALHKAAPATPVSVTVSRDVDSIVDSVRSFVNEYNKLIDDLYSKFQEKRYYDYQPLSEAQKAEMTEGEIERWEERAKSGMLRSDSILRQAISEIRTAITGRVEGVDTQTNMLAVIGITTGNWADKGKLYIDEAKLRGAITDHPDEVTALFVKEGDTVQSTGIGRRLNDVIDKLIVSLNSRAGRPNSTVNQSYLAEAIKDINKKVVAWEARLIAKENMYYKQYGALESFIASMNTQSSWLSQQFGGGS